MDLLPFLPSLFSLSILWAVPSGHHEYTAASTTACTAIHEITSSTSRCLLWFWILLSCWLLWSSSSICSLFLLFLSFLLLAVFSSFWARLLLLLLLIKQRRRGSDLAAAVFMQMIALARVCLLPLLFALFPRLACFFLGQHHPPVAWIHYLFILYTHSVLVVVAMKRSVRRRRKSQHGSTFLHSHFLSSGLHTNFVGNSRTSQQQQQQ